MSQEPRYSQDIDTASPTWVAIDHWLKAQIESGRNSLEEQGIGEAVAEWWRGHLSALRRMRDLPKSDVAIKMTGNVDG
jgi:hypothetical protein